MYHNPHRGRIFWLILPFALLILAACAPKLTPSFSHQGRLLDASGNPVPDGNYTFDYKIYNASSGGTAAYTESRSVPVEDGLFTTSLGLSSTITPTIFAQPTWLEISVNGEALGPRQRLQGSPYAFSLISGAVVQGSETIVRDYAGQSDTGAALTVLNNDATATGGHGLLAINRAAAEGVNRDNVAALQARSLGGATASSTGGYGAIITSNAYRGMYAKGATNYNAAIFDSNIGITIVGGGGCSGCALAYYAQNVGDSPIAAGDFVAVVGVALDSGLNTPVMQVRRATGPSDAVIGVAAGAATRAAVGEYNGVRTGGFEAADGPAAAGGYLSVVVQGLVQARAADAGLQPGAAVDAGADGAVAAAGSGFTRALSAVDGNGRVWIMLGGQ